MILSEDSVFYSLQHTASSIKDMKSENEIVKKGNGILYTHIDDFTETNRLVYSPFYMDNVNSFCKLNGFATLIEMMQNSAAVHSFSALRDILNI